MAPSTIVAILILALILLWIASMTLFKNDVVMLSNSVDNRLMQIQNNVATGINNVKSNVATTVNNAQNSNWFNSLKTDLHNFGQNISNDWNHLVHPQPMVSHYTSPQNY